MSEKQPRKITRQELNDWGKDRAEQAKTEAFWLKIALLPVRPLINLTEKKEDKDQQ